MMSYQDVHSFYEEPFEYWNADIALQRDGINRTYCDRCDILCDADGIIQVDGSYLCPECDELVQPEDQRLRAEGHPKLPGME